jgi:hypothetical protein
VEALSDRLSPASPPPFGLTRQEAAIWAALERLRAAPTRKLIYAGGFGEKQWPTKQLHVMIMRIRAKVVPHGFIIRSRRGWGYELTKETEGAAA